MVDIGAVDPDLMRPARLKPGFQQGKYAREGFADRQFRHGGARGMAGIRKDGHLFAIGRMPADRRVYGRLLERGNTPYQGQVAALGPPRLDLLLKMAVRFVAL